MALSKSLEPYALLPASFSLAAYVFLCSLDSSRTDFSSISGSSSAASTDAALGWEGADSESVTAAFSASRSACFRFLLSFLLGLGVVSLGSYRVSQTAKGQPWKQSFLHNRVGGHGTPRQDASLKGRETYRTTSYVVDSPSSGDNDCDTRDCVDNGLILRHPARNSIPKPWLGGKNAELFRRHWGRDCRHIENITGRERRLQEQIR